MAKAHVLSNTTLDEVQDSGSPQPKFGDSIKNYAMVDSSIFLGVVVKPLSMQLCHKPLCSELLEGASIFCYYVP